MRKYRAVFLVGSTIVALVLLGYILLHNVHFAVLQPAGDVAKQQSALMIFAFCLMMVVVIPVFGMLVFFAWRYRAGNDKKVAYTPEWSGNKWLELVWWSIPILIIMTLGIISVKTAHTLDPYTPIKSANKTLNVQVVALEWKWLFIYPDLGIATVNELPIPVNTPVHFTLSADAPMSAFWVPSLGSMIYTMNGMSSQLNLMADETGTFPGYNTNINGEGYAKMTFNVYSKTTKDFNSWVATAQKSQKMMDVSTLKEISKPGTMNETTYMLMDNKLYEKVVMKYMQGMMPDNGSDSTDATNNHDMTNMGGV